MKIHADDNFLVLGQAKTNAKLASEVSGISLPLYVSQS